MRRVGAGRWLTCSVLLLVLAQNRVDCDQTLSQQLRRYQDDGLPAIPRRLLASSGPRIGGRLRSATLRSLRLQGAADQDALREKDARHLAPEEEFRFSKPALLGALLGCLYAVSPDHLATLLAVTAGVQDPQRALTVGLNWGLGHSAGMVIVCVLLLGLKDVVSVEAWERQGNYLAGCLMISVGLYFLHSEAMFIESKADGSFEAKACSCCQVPAKQLLAPQDLAFVELPSDVPVPSNNWAKMDTRRQARKQLAGGSLIGSGKPYAATELGHVAETGTSHGQQQDSILIDAPSLVPMPGFSSDWAKMDTRRQAGKQLAGGSSIGSGRKSRVKFAAMELEHVPVTDASVDQQQDRTVKTVLIGILQGLCCPSCLLGASVAGQVALAQQRRLAVALFLLVCVAVSTLLSGCLGLCWSLAATRAGSWASPRAVYRCACGATVLLGFVWIAANAEGWMDSLDFTDRMSESIAAAQR